MALPDKGIVYFIIKEDGQADQTFDTQTTAALAFDAPLAGTERVAIRASVLRKKVRVVIESEQI